MDLYLFKIPYRDTKLIIYYLETLKPGFNIIIYILYSKFLIEMFICASDTP